MLVGELSAPACCQSWLCFFVVLRCFEARSTGWGAQWRRPCASLPAVVVRGNKKNAEKIVQPVEISSPNGIIFPFGALSVVVVRRHSSGGKVVGGAAVQTGVAVEISCMCIALG